MSFFLVTNDTDSEIIEGIENIQMFFDTPKGVWTHRSVGYETREVLIEQEGIQPEPCSICKNLYGACYSEPIQTEMIENNMCFYCHFWTGYRFDEGSIIINGCHFIDCGEQEKNPSWLGHGGRRFNILMNDGRKVSTNNLWSQGEIPKHIKDHYSGEFENNAVFVFDKKPICDIFVK